MKMNSNQVYNQIITIVKYYAGMVMALYNTRQIILKSDQHNTTIDHQKLLIISGEALMGIAPHHHIHSSGKKVNKAADILMTSNTLIGHKRKQLTVMNSIYLRKQQIIRQNLEDIDFKRQCKTLYKSITEDEHNVWNNIYLDVPLPILPSVIRRNNNSVSTVRGRTTLSSQPKPIVPIDDKPPKNFHDYFEHLKAQFPEAA